MGDLIDIKSVNIKLNPKVVTVADPLPKSHPQVVLERIKQILAEENCYMRIYSTMEAIGEDTYKAVAHLDIGDVKP